MSDRNRRELLDPRKAEECIQLFTDESRSEDYVKCALFYKNRNIHIITELHDRSLVYIVEQ